MGTYTKLVLRNKSEEHIKAVNQSLHDIGIYKQEYFNKVPYGAFITREQLEEDARL